MKQKYGITREQYEEMMIKQNGRCTICELPERRKGKRNSDGPNRLAIDHCHKTLKVRGLLCHDCNTGIGKFKDDVELMKKAIKYLRKYGDG